MKCKTLLVASLAALCSALALFGGQAHAAAASTLPHRSYSPGQWLQADGVAHTFVYDQPCAATAAKGCVVHTVITVTATRIPAKTHVVTPQDNWWAPQYETITDDYVTCTGPFAACSYYTEARLTSNFEYNSSGNINPVSVSKQQYCGGSNWSCQGIAGTKSYPWNGSYAEDDYGPQQYLGQGGLSQSKWAVIRVDLYGNFSFHNMCTGSLCY